MTVVYHEVLPESYLLILAPGRTGDTVPEVALAHSLRCAERSGKAAVWVDCGMLNSLSREAAELLWASYHHLLTNQSQLVLVHVPDRVRKTLLDRGPGMEPCIVPTLMDAARQPAVQLGQQHL